MRTIKEVIGAQRLFFSSNKTKEVGFRIEQLKKIKALIKANERVLYQAIYKDFGKSEFETYLTELSLLYHELNSFIRQVGQWSKRKRVASGIVNFSARSYIIPEPLGTTLVIGAWNYPFQLSLLPAITALAAGNTVVLKPSELPSETSAVMAGLINENFPADYFCVVEGGVKETNEILEQRFDKVFFTGSIPVGKIVYQAAAKHLTPVTLELGGKSPTFVLADCDIKVAARRIAWAKFLNAGQTCVAPDYVVVEKSIEGAFVNELINELRNYPQSPHVKADNYLRIINEKNFDRLAGLLDGEKVCYGGQMDRGARFFSPTIMSGVLWDDAVMGDEIFGPILPILSFTNVEEAIEKVKSRPKPLACYIYSSNRSQINKILREVSFGGGAVNDSLMHLANSKLPFGGVGFSGFGSYHGKAGFDTFSHYKSILHNSVWFEPKIKYAPYSSTKKRLLKLLLG